MSLAIFDLDNTLIAGDSDYLWGQYLVELGIVDPVAYEAANTQFYEDYKQGRLDIDAFLNFALEPLSRYEMSQLFEWRNLFIQNKIMPVMLPAATDLIQAHVLQGRTPVIITATNAFVTAPIAQLLGIEWLIATEPEIVNNRYTGRYKGIPCFREGKVLRLAQWLKSTERDLGDSWFYTDSHNDIALLEAVEHPVAVDPDEHLRTTAQARQWQTITLRSGELSPDHQVLREKP